MSDIRAIEAAAARLEADASLPDRIASNCRRIGGTARQHHPKGYAHVDYALDVGLREASSFPRGPEMLLSIERLQRRMEEFQAEAEAEIARQACINDAMAMERRRELQAGGAGQPHLDVAFIHATKVCQDRLNCLNRHETGEATFAATLDDAEVAIKAMSAALGLARRASRLRISQEAARAAVAASLAA